MDVSNSRWFVYLLECSDGTYYCGITNNLEKRLNAHNSGKGAKYTRKRGPYILLGTISAPDKISAAKLEYFIKQQSKKEKLRIFQEGRRHEELIPLNI